MTVAATNILVAKTFAHITIIKKRDLDFFVCFAYLLKLFEYNFWLLRKQSIMYLI